MPGAMRTRERKDGGGALSSLLTGMSRDGNSSHPAVAKVTFSPGHHRGRNGAPRPPKMPEKPIQPYVRFTQKVWESVKQNNPEHKVWEISKLISKMWREAADSERQIYFDEYDQAKSEYQEKLASYYRSSQYQNYLQQKTRWDQAEVRDEDDMHFSMEPVDDVTVDDNVYSHRALCAARYHRNKFLMLDILSDNVITNHLKIMRQEQLNSLSYHRQSLIKSIDKYKKDLAKNEEDHEDRKRKWDENSSDLDKEWKRLAAMTPEEYFAEYKAKQEAAKKAREEEERKRKEAEEKQKAEAAKKAAENPTAENEEKSEDTPKDLDENSQEPKLENMENKTVEPKSEHKNENPIDAMHQMVSMAGQSESVQKPSSDLEASQEVKTETQMEIDQPAQPSQAPVEQDPTDTEVPTTTTEQL